MLYLVVCIPVTRLNIWFFGIIVFRPPTGALTGRGRGFHVKGAISEEESLERSRQGRDKEENSPSTKQFPKYSFLAWSGLLYDQPECQDRMNNKRGLGRGGFLWIIGDEAGNSSSGRRSV